MILVTGCARSGTSLTAQILQELGCTLGPEKSVNGLFENVDIRENITKRYLESIGADPLGQKPLPDVDALIAANGLRDDVIRRMGDPVEPWAYKGAKLTFLWPLWDEAFPEAKWIIVRRDAQKIAESCMRTGFMRGYRNIEGWLGWVEDHEIQFERMMDELDARELWPDEYVRDETPFRQLCQFLDLEWEPGVVGRVFDQVRWHGRD
jgi:hypothetical protein